MTMLRMAHKMDNLVGVLKGNTSNATMMNQFQKLAPLLNQQVDSMNIAKMGQTFENFEHSMD